LLVIASGKVTAATSLGSPPAPVRSLTGLDHVPRKLLHLTSAPQYLFIDATGTEATSRSL
jgi:hypothetical protein